MVMEQKTTTDAVYTTAGPLHTSHLLRRTNANRAFAIVYILAILALFYHHYLTLRQSTTTFTTISLLISDIVLAFMWATTTSFRLYPISRKVFPENLERVLAREDFPAIDIFICTADPYKEPPMNVVNTAVSLMAYDYPPEKLSVYVSDDGGSELTLFAFMEAAKFGKIWLPFCRENDITDRCPEVFFRSNYTFPRSENIKTMYEDMKVRVENVVERGQVNMEYVTEEKDHEAFKIWTKGFTKQDHPSVIQVLLESGQDKDERGEPMPNLIYVSREKSKSSHHHFKAGALNTLLRVSAIMTNAPIVLTQDCDMYSNDPKTLRQMLCFYADPSTRSGLGYIQFPQRFQGINKADIYASEYKRLYVINPGGMDGLRGPCYVGSGCFFIRRVFFGGPDSLLSPEVPELSPTSVTNKPIKACEVLDLAHSLAHCNYENDTDWGFKMGFRYGSLSEDFNTGLHQHCRGWKSLFYHPRRPAFLGDLPITLYDALSQNRRWCIGLLEVVFSRYNTLTFGSRYMGLLMGLAYSNNAYWPIWSIPIITYSFLPQLALINRISVFPKVTDTWFFLYVFLFVGAYAQDSIDFVLAQGTLLEWWSDQRMWLMRGLSSYIFGFIEFSIKRLGIASKGFTVTSKVVDDEQSKRYDQGVFEFGVPSPMFVPLVMAAIVNAVAFFSGSLEALRGGDLEGLFGQLLLAGFGILNSWPIYEAIGLRSDKGKMPTEITLVSALITFALSIVSILVSNV